MTAGSRNTVFAAVVVSGAAALVYEVVWSRQLSVFLGITIRAQAVVLAAFMLGLALGSRYLGARADRTVRPMLLFAGLEAAIGIYGVLSAFILPSLAPWYARLASPLEISSVAGDVTRFSVAAAALLAPTFLMGGTIPALVRALAPEAGPGPGSTGIVIGRVYALNTLGAALGAFAAGFVLLPALGTIHTLWVAAFLNLAVAAGIWALHRGRTPLASQTSGDAPREPVEPTTGSAPGRSATLVGFALFGAAALAIQLAWVQALSQILGSSVYAFSLTLSGYLAGLALGGFAFAAWSRRGERWTALPTWVATASGASVVAGLLVFDDLPRFFLLAFRWNLESRLSWLVAFAFLTAWCLMLVPTALFGFLSPLLASDCAARRRSIGGDVGTAYAANTAGTTLGALAAGFWLLPRVGLQNTLLLGALGLIACAAMLLLARRPRPSWARTRALALGAVALVAVAATPRWDPVLTTSGPFINASRILDLPAGSQFRGAMRERNRIVYYAESAVGSVSVRDVGDDRLLVINGKTDGSRLGDRRTQLALGYLPVLLHPDPKEVLVVGYGTGMTPAAIAAHPEVGRIDVIEISPEVIEASRYFAAENRGVLLDPRLRLHHADARNFLLASDRKWDLIVSEPSNPWISGVANLFTREYFELARERLAPRGAMGQWFQSYGMSSEDLRSIVRTFTDVFAHVTIWSPQPGDLILVGSDGSHALDGRRLRRMERLPDVAQDLEATGWGSGEAFLRMLLQDADSSATFGKEVPANTDAHPRVEFNAPRNLYRETTFENMLDLIEHAAGRKTVVPVAGDLVGQPGEEESRPSLSADDGPGTALEPQFRVRWTGLRAAEPTPLPTLGVSLRKVIEVALPDSAEAPIEIDVLQEAGPPSRARLEERIENLTNGAVSTWSVSALADGTPTVRGATGDGVELGIAWGCPSYAESDTLYLAVVAPDTAGDVERSLVCVD